MKKKMNDTIIFVTLFLVITFFVYAPFELYLTNQTEFWFKLSMFAFVPIIISVVVGAFLILVGHVIREKYRQYFSAFIFGLALAIYLQSNFLNLRVGVLNGADINWKDYKVTFVINLLVWIACIVLPCLLVKIKPQLIKRGMSYASALLSAMQIVTLIILMFTSYKPTEDQYRMYVSDKNLFEVSKDDNVVVFLLDMYDDRYFKKIINEEPELANELDGFTQFSNSTGNYSTTNYSIATLFTGQYLYNDKSFSEQVTAAAEKSQMINTLAENGFRLDVYSYSWILPNNILSKTSNWVEGKLIINDYFQFTKTLYQLVACKYLPDIIKPYIWMNGTEFDQYKEVSNNLQMQFDPNNVNFYKKLQDEGISTDSNQKCFKFIHLEGVHYPYYINEKVEMVDEEETSELQCARGALKIAQTYMDEMKRQGVYDNSSIIIMADHGYYWDGVLTNPVLLVKPRYAKGTLKVSDAPVSHHDFQPSVLSLAGLNENLQFGESFFDIPEGIERERLFYQYNLQESAIDGNYRLIEYSIGSDSNARESFQLTDVEYGATGEKYSHKEKCAYCQSGETDPIETEENAPIRVVHDLVK